MTVFEALADETRRRLLVELADGARSAGDLAATEAVSRPAISRHLKVLRQAGLLEVRQDGRRRIYTLRPPGLSPVRELLGRLDTGAEPAVAPQVSEERLAALDLEVRRTVRERRTPESGQATQGKRIMTTTPQPRGRIGTGAHGREVQIERQFRAPIEDVWAAMTESDRLERWIGRWEGDPTTGKVTFFMTAEGDDVEPEEMTITECHAPHRFAADTNVGEGAWRLRFELSQDGDVTTLVFAQALGDDPLGGVGPGWEYYVDRLARTLEGGDPAKVDWDDYYPAMSAYYDELER